MRARMLVRVTALTLVRALIRDDAEVFPPRSEQRLLRRGKQKPGGISSETDTFRSPGLTVQRLTDRGGERRRPRERVDAASKEGPVKEPSCPGFPAAVPQEGQSPRPRLRSPSALRHLPPATTTTTEPTQHRSDWAAEPSINVELPPRKLLLVQNHQSTPTSPPFPLTQSFLRMLTI